MSDTATQILEAAISREGGVTALARHLGERQNVISNWRARGLPRPWRLVLERDEQITALKEQLARKKKKA